VRELPLSNSLELVAQVKHVAAEVPSLASAETHLVIRQDLFIIPERYLTQPLPPLPSKSRQSSDADLGHPYVDDADASSGPEEDEVKALLPEVCAAAPQEDRAQALTSEIEEDPINAASSEFSNVAPLKEQLDEPFEYDLDHQYYCDSCSSHISTSLGAIQHVIRRHINGTLIHEQEYRPDDDNTELPRLTQLSEPEFNDKQHAQNYEKFIKDSPDHPEWAWKIDPISNTPPEPGLRRVASWASERLRRRSSQAAIVLRLQHKPVVHPTWFECCDRECKLKCSPSLCEV
jgi:hypothetical protein